MDADRLPGGLGVWAGRWFLLRYRGRFAGKVIGRTLYWGAALAAGAGAWVAFPSVGARVVVLIIAAVIIGDNIPTFNRRWGAPVTAQTQPALYALVEGVARRLDVPTPDRMWLISFGPAVRLFLDGRRSMLRFHVAAVSCLTRAQLEALVAHELVLSRYQRRRLVLRLRTACLEEMDEREERNRKAERNLARLSSFWSTVEEGSDTAATTFTSSEKAAEAFVIGDLAGLEYTGYQVDVRPPKPEDEAIQDIEEGWPLFVAHGDAPTTMDDDHAREARYHRTLAGPISRLGEVRLELPADRVVLEKIATKDQRRLEPGWRSRSQVRSYTFGSAPAQWWLARARKDADDVREWAGTADDAELLDALVQRADERRGWLNLYAEYRLLADGWRLEHPAVRGVLIDPAGERVDITRMDPDDVRALIAPTLVA